ncbi:MAG: hypothetical protein HQL91_12490 [Magnetococcales bacterium]|nr:hypothetical protein [Magnetococcales bacterium]
MIKRSKKSYIAIILSAPFIYALIFPLSMLDFFLFLYQLVCFPIYGLPKVRRTDYISIDRGALVYLNIIEKLNCLYCGYAVGLLALSREIGSMTEQYWCPIKHARTIKDPHEIYLDFAEFGDSEGYLKRIQVSRGRTAESTTQEDHR